MAEWRIYYVDGETFDDADGEPCDAPPFGVGLIVQSDDDCGRVVVSGMDYYYWCSDEGVWSGGDLVGTLDQFAHFPEHRTALKIGRSIHTHAAWRALQEKALQDPDFLPASRPERQVVRSDAAHRGEWDG